MRSLIYSCFVFFIFYTQFHRSYVMKVAKLYQKIPIASKIMATAKNLKILNLLSFIFIILFLCFHRYNPQYPLNFLRVF